jgi:hypothetical protein
MVGVMTHRMYRALVASVGALALMLTTGESFARPGAASHARSASTHSMSRNSVAQSLRHHRRNNLETFWPDDGFYDDGSSGGEPAGEAPQAPSGDVHYTYKYDVPWDWAHRFPPNGRPYVSSCNAENVLVPGHGGKQQTVSITRCY